MCDLCSQRTLQKSRTDEIKRIKKERLKERKCIKCKSIEKRQWHVYYDDNGNKTNTFICNSCYMKDYNSRPDSYNSTKKTICNCRSNVSIDLGKLDEYSERIKGRIGEDVVSYTLEIENYNDANDNYESLYDLVEHPVYGKIEVKIASFDGIHHQSWDSSAEIEHNFDILIILCMSNEKPWKNVERVYIIPSDCNELYGKRYVSIYKNPSRESKWDKFRVDEKSYNDTYHKMDMYVKYFGEHIEEM